MHATIPTLPEGIHQLAVAGLKEGELNGALNGLLDRTSGKLMAKGLAIVIKVGFGFLVCDDLDAIKKEKSQKFFDNNFILTDPNAEGGSRYYQGKFLIRTTKPEDDMNVYIRFCPKPDELIKNGELNHCAIVACEAISEKEADKIEKDPDKLDLVIKFKDVKAILNLVENPVTDPAQLLLENLVQINGNFGHLFKFGAIGKNAQQAITG